MDYDLHQDQEKIKEISIITDIWLGLKSIFKYMYHDVLGNKWEAGKVWECLLDV
jgi:hypothetical protein